MNLEQGWSQFKNEELSHQEDSVKELIDVLVLGMKQSFEAGWKAALNTMESAKPAHNSRCTKYDK